MAKAPGPLTPQGTTVPYSPDLTGPSEFRTFTALSENEYKLDDGTILRVRPIMVDVRRLKNQWAPDGDPVYVTKIGFAISTQAPAHLRRGAPVAKPSKAKKKEVENIRKRKVR